MVYFPPVGRSASPAAEIDGPTFLMSPRHIFHHRFSCAETRRSFLRAMGPLILTAWAPGSHRDLIEALAPGRDSNKLPESFKIGRIAELVARFLCRERILAAGCQSLPPLLPLVLPN